MLDLPFILTAALDLWNWKLKDPTLPIMLSNLTSITTMTGSDAEIYFHMVPCAMQFAAAPLIPRLFSVHKMMTCQEYVVVVAFLKELTNMFKKFRDIFLEIKGLVDHDIFYNVYRPLLAGFYPEGIILQMASAVCFGDCEKCIDERHCQDNFQKHGLQNSAKNCLLENDYVGSAAGGERSCLEDRGHSTAIEDKVQFVTMKDKGQFLTNGYDHRSETSISQKHGSVCQLPKTGCDSVVTKKTPNCDIYVNPKGPSAGQSTMIILFDLLLGICHWGTGQEFQEEMLNYMPPQHRQMAVDFGQLVSEKGSLRELILQLKDDDCYYDLVAEFNNCIKAVAGFRALHLGIAVKYLVRAKKGTGSSSFRDMLNEMLKSTNNSLIINKVD